MSIEGSDICNDIYNHVELKEEIKNKKLQAILDKGKFYPIPQSSEDVAQLVHLALCVTL